jgi:hypothetical protein
LSAKLPTLLLINGAQFGYSAGHYHYCKYLKGEFNIHYVCYDRNLPKMELPHVKVTYIPFDKSKTRRLISFFKTARNISRSLNPDVLYIVYFNFSVLLKLICIGKTKILDIRTGSLNNNALMRNLSNIFITFQSLFFKKIIILSESLRSKLGISAKKTLLLPLGAEIYFESEHDYKNMQLLYIGALDGREINKTISGLSIYLKKFPERRSEIAYTIIGFGSEEEISKITKSISDNNLVDIVKYEGRKNYTELEPYLKQANIGVSFVPITEFYNSQPPTKTFEYILNGLFTIATGTSENKLLIIETNGLICNDDEISFSNSLEAYQLVKHKLNSKAIRNSLMAFEWSKLVKTKLIPFIK